jgi:hypothetical protein
MPVSLIITLLTTFGPSAVNLVSALITKWETNGTVTAAEWANLTASITQTAQDHMKAQLTSAGIDPTSPQGTAMLALVK